MNPNNKKPLGESAHYKWQAKEPELKEFVAKVVRETRFARNVEIKDIAKEIDISPTALYRWERGDIGRMPAALIYWLFKDHEGNDSMDPLYWRKRAILAEDALSRMSEAIDDFKEAREEALNNERNGAGKRSTGNHNGS